MRKVYRVQELLFDGWFSHSIHGGFTDTFELHVDALGGLPPQDYANGLRGVGRRLERLRPRASLWVRVISPSGRWYHEVLREALREGGFSTAVTPFDAPFDPLNFTIWPVADAHPAKSPPGHVPEEPYWTWPRSQRRLLQIMARLDSAYTREIAVASGLGRTQTYHLLSRLREEGWVEKVKPDGYEFWRITRKGLSAALRLWRIPPGHHFKERRERQTPPSTHETGSVSKHNRTKRLWRDWLRTSVMGSAVEIYAVWTEVVLPVNTICDALAWGTYRQRETLFWLEVLSSKKGRTQLREDVVKKTNAALSYGITYNIPIVLTFLGSHWVLEELGGVFGSLPETLAVIAAPWHKFGHLPMPRWGGFQYLSA